MTFIRTRYNRNQNRSYALLRDGNEFVVETMDVETGIRQELERFEHNGTLVDLQAARALALGAYRTAHLLY